MKEEQISALKSYIIAVVKEHIATALGQDALQETLTRIDAESLLDRVLDDFTD